MNKLLKNIYFGIIQFCNTIISLLCVCVFNRCWVSSGIKKEFKDRQGRSATLLANGPSLRHILEDRRDLLKDTDIMVVNYFGNSPVFSQLKPKYYIILDPVFFDETSRPKEEITQGKAHIINKQLWENLNKIDWEMTMFIPKGVKKMAQNKISNKKIRFVAYQATRVLGYTKFQNFMYRHNQGVPCSRNIVLPAMINLINIGYKTIYMYGIEFSWIKIIDVDPKNGLTYMNDKHFYSEEEIRYFGKGYYKRMLGVLYEDLNGTDQIAKYAESRGVRMVNRTIGSFIDSFEYENPDMI